MSDDNIYKKINAVMKQVKYVQKDKQVNGGGQNYKAVTHDQLLSVIRSEMVKNGIVVVPHQVEGRLLIQRDVEKQIKMHLYQGVYDIALVNVDNPSDKLVSRIHAHAADNGDKAPGKAITYATKSALLKIFSLETGEDDESRDDWRQTIDEERENEIKALIKSTGTDTATFCKAYRVSAVNELPVAEVSKAINQLKRKAARVAK